MLGQMNSGKAAIDTYRTMVNTFITQSIIFETAAQVYRALVSPSSGDKTTFDNAKSTYDGYLASMTAAVTAETLNGQPTLNSLATQMAAACTSKIAAVSIAATAKTTADTAAATAGTEKKAADANLSSATTADTLTYLAVVEVCPGFARTVP